jgi:hypothetical protein
MRRTISPAGGEATSDGTTKQTANNAAATDERESMRGSFRDDVTDRHTGGGSAERGSRLATAIAFER